MKTLYEVLGVRPDDNADAFKRAFRIGIKVCHPDVHADDPHAAVRFRQLVEAYTILRDPEQRAAYDQLLALEREEVRATPRRYTTRKFVFDAIAAASLAVVVAGGYALFADTSSSLRADKVIALPWHGPAKIDAVQPPAPTDTANQQGEPRDKLAGVEALNTLAAPSGVASAERALALAANNNDAPGNAHEGPAPSAARPDGPAILDSANEPLDQKRVRLVGVQSSGERDTRFPRWPFERSDAMHGTKPRDMKAPGRPPMVAKRKAHHAHYKRVWLARPNVGGAQSKKVKARSATTTLQYADRHAKVRVTGAPAEKPCAARTWAGCQGWDPDPNVRSMIQMDAGRDDR